MRAANYSRCHPCYISWWTLGHWALKPVRDSIRKVNCEILSLNPVTLVYEPAQPLQLGDIKGIQKHKDLSKRLQLLYKDKGRAGQFFRQSVLNILGYSARRMPEIAERPVEIDRAMKWGFGWECGPFELWDTLGFTTVLAGDEVSRDPDSRLDRNNEATGNHLLL